MKVIDLLNDDKLSLSFEVFPPKTESAFDSVKEAIEEIAKLHPSFMSVTYGAGGGTSQYTLDITKDINERYGVPSLAHLTCVSSNRDTVREKIQAIQEAGIENVMALRGTVFLAPAGTGCRNHILGLCVWCSSLCGAGLCVLPWDACGKVSLGMVPV